MHGIRFYDDAGTATLEVMVTEGGVSIEFLDENSEDDNRVVWLESDDACQLLGYLDMNEHLHLDVEEE